MTASGTWPTAPLWVMGDVHGQFERLRALLSRAGLLDHGGHWSGGNAHLVLLGDLTDRGADGAGVVRLARRLDGEALAAGGRADTLLGNHEVMLLAAQHFGSGFKNERGRSFMERWQNNGGHQRDLQALGPEDLDWLSHRPAMLQQGRYLLLHADSPFYLKYGHTPELINQALTAALTRPDPATLDRLVSAFVTRRAFEGDHGPQQARQLLETLGGRLIVHGHTPISVVLGKSAPEINSPLLYARGLALNLDGGLGYSAQAGFLTRLDERGVAQVVV